MADFVFIGDSIIEWLHTRHYFPDLIISNHGIAGDTISGVGNRLNFAIQEKPNGILVMVGHNDLVMYPYPEDALQEYEKLCQPLESSGIQRVFITGLLPIDFIPAQTVIKFNDGIKVLAKKKKFTFIPVREKFILENGKARPDLSDGLHLTEQGYNVLADVIKKNICI